MMRDVNLSGKIRRLGILLLVSFVLLMTGCGGESGAASSVDTSTKKAAEKTEASKKADASEKDTSQAPKKKKGTYKAPPFADSEYQGEEAVDYGDVYVDDSSLELGYVGVSAMSDCELKMQIIKDDLTYTYDVPNDGTPVIFPLQCGDGDYYYRIMENISGSKYSMLEEGNLDVVLKDEFQPFIRPSDYVLYTEGSACVEKAAELAKNAGDELELVNQVFEFITKNVTYDKEKAATVQAGYLPDPDETMLTGKGICFDYAALSAAMLRSQGIPVKMVFGYVSPDDVYHAWNMFYTKETGWVSVEYKVDQKTWARLDTTFSSGGAPADFVGDGSNYADLYYY